MCQYTKRSCPYGLHLCQLCGKGGHGAEDCKAITTNDPALAPSSDLPKPSPPPFPPPGRLVAMRNIKQMSCSQSKASGYAFSAMDATTEVRASHAPSPFAATAAQTASSSAVVAPGFGKKGKGDGKMTNCGIAIEPPTIDAEAVLPFALQQPSRSASVHGAISGASKRSCPDPIPATSELVDAWIARCFKPLKSLSTKIIPQIGESILIGGVKTGRAGRPTVEYFAGKVFHIEVEGPTPNVFVHIDKGAVREVRKVHQSYMEVPDEDWLKAYGGRCYRKSTLRHNFIEMVRCPDCPCERWLPSQEAYRQHWNSVHTTS